MPTKRLRFRLLMLAAAAGFLGIALAIRMLGANALNSTGRLEQYSGTALYASMVYVGALFLWPRWSPLPAGGMTLAWCWAMECFQLTGLPAELSGRSLLARLVLGVRFDPTDLLWYPIGIVPLVAVHHLIRQRRLTERLSERNPGGCRAGAVGPTAGRVGPRKRPDFPRCRYRRRAVARDHPPTDGSR